MSLFRWSVTFEFDEQAPETVCGEIVAGTAHIAASRAVKAARRAKPNMRARSLVVLLEANEDQAAGK